MMTFCHLNPSVKYKSNQILLKNAFENVWVKWENIFMEK